uniref:Odorant-binding protein 8 n=1 Tax=Matsumurasca onukii TaxID=2912585 RepID=A0A343WGW6_MATON|nr:odorant-binding protein 8 [Matsumurasca onukii]
MLVKTALICFICLCLFQENQAQQLSKKSVRKKLLEAVKKCKEEHNPPQGVGVTFFTNPEETDYTSKCFTECILENFQIMDTKGNYKKEKMQSFIKSLPDSRFKTSIESNLDLCLQTNADNKCEKGYRFIQCFYKRAVSS